MMASTQLAEPSSIQATSPRCLNLCSASGVRYPGSITRPLDMVSLYGVVEQGNKIDTITLEDVWEFRIIGLDEVVGYMRDCVQREMVWDHDNFHLDHEARTILLSPEVRNGEDAAASCRRALSGLCLLNRGRFNNCFDQWLAKNALRREFQPIHVTDSKRQDLTIPLPARGLVGAVTVGAHLNAYTIRKIDGRETVDRIWVSHRARAANVSYSGMLDQIVAGGMDPTDRIAGAFSPCVTLKREAEEEAGLFLDLDSKTMSVDDDDGRRRHVGSVEQAPVITFYDCKGREAGRGNEGHLEPGARFVYDLKIDDANFQPRTQERSIEKFEALTVDEVKRSLRDRRWKPNCGLVMLDFLVRKRLVTETDEERLGDIVAGLRRPLPFRFAQDGFRVFHRW